MRLYLTVRRALAGVLMILAVSTLLALAGDVVVPIPTLTIATLAVPLSVLLPLAVPIVAVWALEEGDATLESVASRPVEQIDLVIALGLGTSTAMIAAGLGATIGPTPEAFVASRNAAGYLGLALIARAVFGGTSAPLVPAAYALGAILFGPTATGEPHVWAWPINPPNGMSWAFAVGALAIGCLGHLWPRPVHRAE